VHQSDEGQGHQTLRFDWFLSDDSTECEIREAYVDSAGFLEHRLNVGDPLAKLFAEFAEAHTTYGYGDASNELVEYVTVRMLAGSVKWYLFLDGFQAEASQPVTARTPASSGYFGGRPRGLLLLDMDFLLYEVSVQRGDGQCRTATRSDGAGGSQSESAGPSCAERPSGVPLGASAHGNALA
jgi:hypothetical protein